MNLKVIVTRQLLDIIVDLFIMEDLIRNLVLPSDHVIGATASPTTATTTTNTTTTTTYISDNVIHLLLIRQIDKYRR